MLRYLALGAFLVALAAPVSLTPSVAATPAPAPKKPAAAKTAAPAPQPEPTNPFNLSPVAPPTPNLPVIGTTRAKPVCTAIRRSVAPAVQAAMKNDQTYSDVRKRIFDYIVKDSDAAKDLHLTQMDRQVDAILANVKQIEEALKTLDVPANARPEDAKLLRDLKTTLTGVLAAQKTEMSVLSGFVETERMRRFGKLSEAEENMQKAVAPSINGTLATPFPVSGFLRQSGPVFDPQRNVTPNGLADGHLVDHDLGDLAAFTSRLEDTASKVIVTAANSCKAQPQQSPQP
ncbi:MAG TPA: hypothetical protein VGD01_05060 [Candidatus Elarobacter sp.]